MKRLLFIITTGLSIFCHKEAQAQVTYIPMGTDEYTLIDRLEGMIGENNPHFMTSLKPYSRWDAHQTVADINESAQMLMMNNIPKRDLYNIKRFLDLNGEWGTGNYTYDDATPRRERPFLKYFYSTAQHMLLFSDEDYFISVNPVLHLQGGLDEYSEDLGFINRRGVEMRARLFNMIGIYSTISDNQERVPRYINAVGNKWNAYPGYSDFTKGGPTRPYDAFYARGYVDLPIYGEYAGLTFGFDKNFIGDGIRSMILSDVGAPSTFLRLRYKVGSFFYQNLFMEHMTDYSGPLDLSRPKKYSSIHYLGFKVSPKVELALVETTNYDLNELKADIFMPVILARTGQRILEKDDVSFRHSLALTSKIVWTRDIMSYTQLNVQNANFNSDDAFKNQMAMQVGLKYLNVGGLKHLDAQLEWNAATPFMYASNSKNTNFTHYNQPLAHPLESAFNEFILKLSYQVIDPMTLEFRGIYTTGSPYGVTGTSNGSSIFSSTDFRNPLDVYDFFGNGQFSSTHVALSGSYEFFPNMHVDAGIHYVQSSSKIDRQSFSNFLLYTGVRINALKRMFDWNF